MALAVAPALAQAHSGPTGGMAQLTVATPAETVAAREHFFGSENVAADGRVRSDRVILSWFSVASLAMAIDGHVVLLDTYIHKGEDKPNYVPTTTDEVAALDPEAIFIGHGHFDHAKTGGRDRGAHGRRGRGHARALRPGDRGGRRVPEAGRRPSAVSTRWTGTRSPAPRSASSGRSETGSQVSALKHVHSDAEPPDGEGHETSLTGRGLPGRERDPPPPARARASCRG